jgi:nucleotide-binding universal stress UspA family protein
VPGPSGAQLCDYLKYHGIEAGEVTAPPTGRKGGAAILEEADKIGADLLIKGAYTQSRLRQMILGGPTSYLLSHSHLPIFMEH